MDSAIADPAVATAVRFIAPFSALAGTALSLAAGRLGHDAARALRHDALSALALVAAIFALALGGLPRDVIGLVVVLAVVARIAPAGRWAIRFGAPPLFALALAFAAYAPFAAWRVASSLPFGDQVFYLLSADGLAHGSLDATIDPQRFTALLGVVPQAIDAATHVAASPAGPRLVQGYALPALLAPGWALGGELGATLVVAFFAAWAALQTWLILADTIGDTRVARVTWALAAFCTPAVLGAIHVYPNAVGAALIATGFRAAFTAPIRAPLVAGVALGATAFLNPRDGLVLAALLPFVMRWPEGRARFAAGAATLVVVAAFVSLVAFGVPLPYAGYVFGTEQAQGIQPEPTWNFRFWVALPAILFDRVFGVAGTAPWLLLAALGVVPALRARRDALLPAAAAVGASLVVLSLFRLWEGGYAPPNRYLVDVLPLIAPFVAYGVAAARGLVVRGIVAVTLAVSVLASALLVAVPTAALNTAFEDKPGALLSAALGIDPLGWLPSFQPVTADWWIAAYLRLVPALAVVAYLVWSGRRASRA